MRCSRATNAEAVEACAGTQATRTRSRNIVGFINGDSGAPGGGAGARRRENFWPPVLAKSLARGLAKSRGHLLVPAQYWSTPLVTTWSP